MSCEAWFTLPSALDGDAVVVRLDMRVAHRYPRRRVDVDTIAAGDIVFGTDVNAVYCKTVGEKDVHAPERLVADVHPADGAPVAMVETDRLGSSGEGQAQSFPFQALCVDGTLAREPAALVVVEVEQGCSRLFDPSLPTRGDERIECR